MWRRLLFRMRFSSSALVCLGPATIRPNPIGVLPIGRDSLAVEEGKTNPDEDDHGGCDPKVVLGFLL